MVFTVFLQHDGTLAHKLEVGFLLVDFIFSYVTFPFWGSDEELGCSRLKIDIFELYFFDIAAIVL